MGGGYDSLGKTLWAFNYAKTNDRTFTKFVAEASMRSAASEYKNGGVTDASVSVDGTWQKRGFSSLDGVVAAISIDTGKVVDCEVMASYCKACKSIEHLKITDPQAYATWQETHECSLNVYDSAPKIASTGTKRIFESSIETNNLRYMNFYGHGDSKGLKTVEYIYGDNDPVNKQECIGHYQKRVGCRLQKLRSKEHLDGKKGGLTNSIIDRLQNLFGIPLRQNIGNLKAMEDAIIAYISCIKLSPVLPENYEQLVPLPKRQGQWY